MLGFTAFLDTLATRDNYNGRSSEQMRVTRETCSHHPSQAQSIHKPAYRGSCMTQKFCVLHDNTECCIAESSRITNQEFSGQCVKQEKFTQARCSNCHSNNTCESNKERHTQKDPRNHRSTHQQSLLILPSAYAAPSTKTTPSNCSCSHRKVLCDFMFYA